MEAGEQRPQGWNAGAYDTNGIFDKTPKEDARGVDYQAFNRESDSNFESKILHVTSVKNSMGLALIPFIV